MIQLLTIFEAVQSLMQKESVANFKAVLNLIYRPQDMNFPEAEVAFIWVPFQAQNNDIASYAWELRYFWKDQRRFARAEKQGSLRE